MGLIDGFVQTIFNMAMWGMVLVALVIMAFAVPFYWKDYDDRQRRRVRGLTLFLPLFAFTVQCLEGWIGFGRMLLWAAPLGVLIALVSWVGLPLALTAIAVKWDNRGRE